MKIHVNLTKKQKLTIIKVATIFLNIKIIWHEIQHKKPF